MIMPNAKKIATVNSLKEKIKKAKSMVLTDYRGLTHKQLEELRSKLKKLQAEFTVTKNTLFLQASDNKDLKESYPETFSGPTATLFANDNEIEPLKELAKFAKIFNLPKIKLGIFGDNIYSEDEVIRLSKIPSREVLLAQVAFSMKAPITGLVYTLNGNLQKLVLVLEEVRKKKSN